MINKPKISLLLIGLLAVIGLTITAGSTTPSVQVCAEGKTNCTSQSTESMVVMQSKMHKGPGKLLLVKISSFDKGVVRGTIVEPKDAVAGPMPESHNPLLIRPEDVIALSSKGEFTFNLPPKPDFKHEMIHGNCANMMKDMQHKMHMDCQSGECGKGISISGIKGNRSDKMVVGNDSVKPCDGNCKDIKACAGNCKIIMISKDSKDCKDGKKVYVKEVKIKKGEDCQIVVDGKPINIDKVCKPGEECKIEVITNKDGKTIKVYMSKPEKDNNYRIESKDGKKFYVKEIKIDKGEKEVMWIDGKEVPMGEKGKMMPPHVCPTCGQPMPPHRMMMGGAMGGHKGMMMGDMMMFPDPKPGDVIALIVSEKDIQAALTGSLTTFNVLSLMPPAMDPSHMKMMFMKDKQEKKQENCNKECEQPCK